MSDTRAMTVGRAHAVRIGLMTGDGIGHEIVPATQQVVSAAVAAAGAAVDWVALPLGRDAIDTHGTPVPDSTLDALDESLDRKIRVRGPNTTTGDRVGTDGASLVLDAVVRVRPGDAVHPPEWLLVGGHRTAHPTARTAPSKGMFPRISLTSCGVIFFF